ncbi:MAG: glycosyl transferase [Alphaproteobacteria bacterium]
MAEWLLLPALGIGAVAAASCGSVGLVRTLLFRQGILDRPNERSSHTTATPRGGGIGLLAVLLPVWAAIGLSRGGAGWLVAALALLLAGVSWRDDLRGLPTVPRLVAHLAVAAAGVALIPETVFQGLLPPFWDRVTATIALAWFINLFNFMDGIDGISGVEAVALGAGLFAIGAASGSLGEASWQGLVLAAAAAGFLVWNWPPARVFLGDVGSVPMGFLLGWLLLALAARGHWAEALLLPLYYLADTGLTILLRLRRRENVFRAHRQHFYQRAVRNGRSHATVAAAVLVVDVVLVGHAVVVALVGAPAVWPALISGVAFVAGLLAWMTLPVQNAAKLP